MLFAESQRKSADFEQSELTVHRKARSEIWAQTLVIIFFLIYVPDLLTVCASANPNVRIY